MVIEFIKKKREEYPMLGQEPIWMEKFNKILFEQLGKE